MKESEEEVEEVEEEEWEDKKMYTYLTVYTSPTDVCV